MHIFLPVVGRFLARGIPALNRHSFQALHGALLPGTGGGYGNFSTFGLPGTSNLFTLNGNDYNDPFLNLNNSGSSNLLLGGNELQEVAVVNNGYTGQYGRQAGSQIDYTTKAGTNSWHGNAVYNWTGRFLNANDPFNKATSPAGAPSIHDRSKTTISGPLLLAGR